MTQPRIEAVPLPAPRPRAVASRLATLVSAVARHGLRPGGGSMATRARGMFDDLGGTFLKFGQLFASSPGLFGESVAAEFRSCLDAGPPVDFLDVRRTIETELGEPLDVMFATFDTKPVAAASLAVVHRATLHDGTPVAVKVLRPDVEANIAADLAIIEPAFRFLGRQVAIGIFGALPGLADGLAAQLGEELDFRNEARALVWFRDVLLAIGSTEVVVPDVYAAHSARRVLTMSWIEGVPVDDAAAIDAMGVDPGPLLRACIRVWFAATLATGGFHGDIHAGNLLVTPDGRVGLLDFGIVGRLDGETRFFFRRMLEGLLGDESAWVDIADHIDRTYGVRDLLPFEDDDHYIAFVRAQVEPILTKPFGEVDLKMLVNNQDPDQPSPAPSSRREFLRFWWAERARLQALLDSEGFGGGFDRGTFLLSKQLVYMERYGKLYLPDTPIIEDRDAFRALLDEQPLERTA